MMKFSFTARTEPACKEFLSIRKEGDSFETIDAFIRRYPNITTEEVNQCDVYYRGTTKPMKDWLNDYNRFISGMTIHDFEYHTMMDKSLIVAQYFVNKAIDCLQFARFFTIKSALILDTNYNINWNTGYPSQFIIRCIYFGTACTWYQNTMDHILQAVYWSHELYKNVTDRDNIVYNDTWNDKKIIENCTYEFVVGDLKAKNLTDIRKKLQLARQIQRQLECGRTILNIKVELIINILSQPFLLRYLSSLQRIQIHHLSRLMISSLLLKLISMMNLKS